MIFTLRRFGYSPTETEGVLTVADLRCPTIERPWIPDPDHKGGLGFRSCVPDGSYILRPHLRPNGDRTWALINEDLNVYYKKSDIPVPGMGRYLILIHAANYVDDVVGCIGPGKERTIYNNRRMVTASRLTMSKILQRAEWRAHALKVESQCGTDCLYGE